MLRADHCYQKIVPLERPVSPPGTSSQGLQTLLLDQSHRGATFLSWVNPDYSNAVKQESGRMMASC